MTARSLPHGSLRRASPNALLQLGWLHFWLLSGILGGMLGLVGLVFVYYLTTF